MGRLSVAASKALSLLHHPSLSQSLTAFTAVSHVKQVHAHLIVTGDAQQNIFTTTRLLACAALCGSPDLSYAEAIFRHTPAPTFFMHNTLLRAYSRSPADSPDGIALYVHLLRAGFFPDKFTFPFVLHSCGLLENLFLGRQLHGHVVKFGLCHDVFVVNNVMGMYSSCAELGSARQLFDESLDIANVVSWTILVTGCSNSGDIDTARAYFDQMPSKNSVSWNAMITGYGRVGRISDARELFNAMPERDSASWGALISGYTENKLFMEALVLIREMVNRGEVPNEAAIVSAVSACAHLRALEEGDWLYELVKEIGFDGNVILGTALLDMFGKCGNIRKALMVFNLMPAKNIYSWNSMIAGLAFNGYGREVLSLFWKMQLLGTTPNSITFISLLSGCSHSGLVDEGLHLFNMMTQKYRIKPQLEHYGSVVDLLGRAGLIEEAVHFVEGLPVGPHSGLWGALAGACRIHGEVELGREVAERLVELEPQHSGRYALLSNILASARRWDGVEMVRKLLKDRKVLKTPGSSIL
ncbi:pentatricopeptide repeat-containing protein At1g74630-like [Punica granatum]|uniref:Uncharacterized protein n=2 Tax=Punica granatum TaxID=22663 RepID=A0A2I0GBP6_PUNGR|nr:pentatricopeptide repeat-containing protein At1g74630-like [Punica granatum]PKH47701.1 hypothetical protein CRG98_050469 [Punica granatum]